jgi:L-glyceraldehyde 3-phosphate reductase
VASLDQSLQRLGIDYVDIFYHHRPDPDTPLEETMGALDFIVRSGRALYAGISMYPPDLTRRATEILHSLGTPCLIHQPNYSLFDRWVERGLLEVLNEEGVGCIVFSPLAQGLLTDRYLEGIPGDSRAARDDSYLSRAQVTDELVSKVKKLSEIAAGRGQSMAQLAIAWVLRQPTVTSALIGASRPSQIEAAVGALDRLDFADDELIAIERVLTR